MARELRNLSQAELAGRAGIQSTSVAHFEAGSRKPSLDNFIKLVEALEVSADYLIGVSEEVTQSRSVDRLALKLQDLTSEDRDLAVEILSVLANRSKK